MERKRRFAEFAVNIDDDLTERTDATRDQRKIQRTLEDADANIDDILKLVDEAPDVPQLDAGSVGVIVSTLEKAILKNQQMRVKYGDNPKKFMDSEIDLDAAVKEIHDICAAPELYSKFASLGGPSLLLTLLAHENTDIALEVIDLLSELTDPSTIVEDEGTLDVIEKLASPQLFELLVQNLGRLANSEEDTRGVFNILNIFENFAEVDSNYTVILCQSTSILRFLLTKIQKTPVDENTLYCAELLSTFVNSENDVIRNRIVEYDGISKIFDVLSTFSRSSKESKERLELYNNLFDILTACLTPLDGKRLFLDAKTCVRTLTRMIKLDKDFVLGALRVITAALSDSADNCKKFVSENGLKTIFALFMKKSKNEKNKNLAEKDTNEENLVTVIAHLFLHLRDTDYTRLLRKFVENKYEKIDRLVQLRDKFLTRLEASDKNAQDNVNEEARYLRRLEKGLFTLQMIDLVIGFLYTAGDDHMKKRILQLMHQQDCEISDVKKTLDEYRLNLGEDTSSSITKEILQSISDLIQ
eukprot:233074_1